MTVTLARWLLAQSGHHLRADAALPAGALTRFMRERGAEAVSVAELGYVFSKDNPLYAKLEAGL